MRSKSLVLVGSIVLLLGLGLFEFRAQLVTRAWHWRHGESVKVGSYQFPVPRNWVATSETVDSATLVEVTGQREKNLWPPPIIFVTVFRTQHPINLDFWESIQQQVAKRSGSVIVNSRSLAFDGETLRCLNEGDKLHIPKTPLDSIDCQSAAGLALVFTGTQKDSEEFYKLLPQVHRILVR